MVKSRIGPLIVASFDRDVTHHQTPELGQIFGGSEKIEPKSGILHIYLTQCILRRRCRLGLDATS